MSRAEGRLVGGRYQLVEPIGRGGMGVVWRAHDQLLDREVAVKEVRYDSAMGDELSDLNRRTMREARAAGRLTHPNVVVVHDVIEEDDRPWIIMQLVTSRSLGQVIRRTARCPPSAPSRSACRSWTRCAPPIARACCTATSSPRTCCSPMTAGWS
ncbi:hypothetical protein GCM10027612_39160 [Microbispora bryophytorum subsp. camponoti]